MDDKLKALQEGSQEVEVSPVLSEGQSPEATKQERVTPKSTDVEICKMGTTQDCDNSPEILMKDQIRKGVTIDSIIILDGGLPVITLKIRNHFSKKTRYDQIPMNDFSPKKLREYVTRNGGISSNWNVLYEELTNDIRMYMQRDFIKVMNGHTKLGWIKGTDSLSFCHQQMITSDDQNSEYMGNVDIEAKGTLDNIVRMIKELILSTSEWSPLQAIIAFSIASVVLPYAKLAWGKSMNNPTLHLVGNSTSGKSTSLRLHVGLASNPFNEKFGLWLNHQSSLAAMIRRIGDNQGLPVSIDELSSGSKKEYTDFVYGIGNGEEKDRLKAGGTAFCDSANFSTVVLSSGEVSILRKCSNTAGIRARCVELCNVKWTDSKEQADAICDCLKNNYGWVAPLVAKELLNNSDKWKTRWDQIYDQIKQQMDKENIRLAIGQRISEYVVLFTLAAEIANEILSISLNVEKIRDFCYLHIITVNADEANIGERAYEYLIRYAAEHKDDFADGSRCEEFYGSYSVGAGKKGFFREARKTRKINGIEYDRQIVFFKEAYEQILETGGFSLAVVNHELRKANLLQTKDKKRYTCKVTYNDNYLDCYVLYCYDLIARMAEAFNNKTLDIFEDYEGQ